MDVSLATYVVIPTQAACRPDFSSLCLCNTCWTGRCMYHFSLAGVVLRELKYQSIALSGQGLTHLHEKPTYGRDGWPKVPEVAQRT